MKWSPPGPHFGEQVNDLTRIFLGWNTCEQTIVLYALMRKIPTAQAKFLSRTIQHHLESLTDLNNLETNANNPVFIKSLQSESTEVALHQLLTHLPLLRPDNADCKDCYLTVITEVASACTSTGQYTEQIQQLLSYTLIHPAIASQDRGGLSQFLRVLEARIISTPIDEYTRLSSSRWDGTCLKSSASSKQQQQQQQHQHQQQQQQQQSQGKFNNSYNLHTGVINLGRQSPPSSCASSGSEGRLDIASSQKFTSNIGNMMVWLKSLRLHKYSYLFTTMCYEDMLNLTEDQLADKGVTQGARHKLALSIQKLHERYSILINLEKKLSERPVDGCNFRSFTQESALLASALEELNAILSTPIYRCKDQDDAQDRPEHDIPAQFVQVLCKLCSRLSPETSDEQIICGCINILEKVLQHECFTMEQKEMVQPWHSGLGSPRIMQKMQHGGYSYIRRFNPPAHSRKPSSHMNIGHVYNHQQANPMIGHHRDSFSQQYGHHGLGQSIIMNANYTTAKRSSLQETRIEHPQRPLQRTNSAPRDHFLSQSSTTSPVVVEPTDPELNSRLESLCLRMTEQAIGGFGEA